MYETVKACFLNKKKLIDFVDLGIKKSFNMTKSLSKI